VQRLKAYAPPMPNVDKRGTRMLPSLTITTTGETAARVARLNLRGGRPAPPPRARRLGVASPFLPAPTAIEFERKRFVWKDNDLLTDAAEALLAQRHPRAMPAVYFLYVYVSEQGEALILAIEGTNKTIYSITRAVTNAYSEFEASDVIDSSAIRNDLQAEREQRTVRIEMLRAELQSEEAALKEVLAELSSLPVLVATAEESAEAERFRREPEPPLALQPTIRKERRPPKPPPSSSTEPVVQELSDGEEE